MNEIRLVVLGDPKSQKRHRSVRMGKSIRQYDPSADDKADLLSVVQRHAPEFPFSIPLSVEIQLYFQRPNAHYGTGKNAGVLKPNTPVWHTSKPDVDNATKFCMDALNKVFWRDDSIICHTNVIKQYSDQPRTVIIIRDIADMDF